MSVCEVFIQGMDFWNMDKMKSEMFSSQETYFPESFWVTIRRWMERLQVCLSGRCWQTRQAPAGHYNWSDTELSSQNPKQWHHSPRHIDKVKHSLSLLLSSLDFSVNYFDSLPRRVSIGRPQGGGSGEGAAFPTFCCQATWGTCGTAHTKGSSSAAALFKFL